MTYVDPLQVAQLVAALTLIGTGLKYIAQAILISAVLRAIWNK